MSTLTRFMTAAQGILAANEQNRSFENGQRVNPFVSTTWCFAEIDEALAKCVKLSADVKMARLRSDLTEARRLTAELRRTSYQIHEMALTAAGVFGSEET
ncbi:MAG: hypothetical protein V4458_06025 [Pseudomonadota bacterium]|mgnify:CR=1 FL=1